VTLPAAVVFDFDGLMLDTELTGYLSTAAVFEAHGREFPLEVWQKFIGSTEHPHWSDLLDEQLDVPLDREHWIPRRIADGMQRARALDLLDGVGDLIASLGEVGIPLAVASSSPGDWVRTHIEERGLGVAFSAVCTGDEVERTKPDPAVYLLACERLGVDPSTAVALEDSVPGVTAAKASGLAAVGVPGHMTAHMDYSAADMVVGSCAELDPVRLGRVVARNITG
jgi:HAD superfamily hydrolase (TIGR01509 family)